MWVSQIRIRILGYRSGQIKLFHGLKVLQYATPHMTLGQLVLAQFLSTIKSTLYLTGSGKILMMFNSFNFSYSALYSISVDVLWVAHHLTCVMVNTLLQALTLWPCIVLITKCELQIHQFVNTCGAYVCQCTIYDWCISQVFEVWIAFFTHPCR